MMSVKTSDILIIGAGPAGLSAALAAAPSGFSIVIIDDNPLPGGQIWRDGQGAEVPNKAKRIYTQLAQYPNIRWLLGTKVVSVVPNDAYHRYGFLVENADSGWIQYTDKVILSTGGRELLLPFSGWTLPGVTGAGGLQAFIKSGMPVIGQRIIVTGTGPLLLATAKTAKKAGADVIYIAEQTSRYHWLRFGLSLLQWPKKFIQALGLLTPKLHLSSYVKSVRLRGGQLLVTLQQGHIEIDLECDRLATGYGIVANTELADLLGCDLSDDHQSVKVNDMMETSLPRVYAIGEGTGFGGSDKAIIEGKIAGYHAINSIDQSMLLIKQHHHWLRFAASLQRNFALNNTIRQVPTSRTLVCRCEDVTYGELAHRDGWIDAKLHTRCGMGPCQGKICGKACETLFKWQRVPQRHLLAPVRVSSLAQYSSIEKHSSV